jgi:hypothetical protein
MSSYPTGADLRAAAAAATLRRCDDPLLGEILAAASRAAAQGETSCHLEFSAAQVGEERRGRIVRALGALGVRGDWDPMLAPGVTTLFLSWD